MSDPLPVRPSPNTPPNSNREGRSRLVKIQRFVYVLEGELSTPGHTLVPGSYLYASTALTAKSAARAAVIEKPYIVQPGSELPDAFSGYEPDIASKPLLDDDAIQVRCLLPDRPRFRFRREHHDLPARRDPSDGGNPRHGARPADALRRRHLPPERFLVSRHRRRLHLDGALLPAVVRSAWERRRRNTSSTKIGTAIPWPHEPDHRQPTPRPRNWNS